MAIVSNWPNIALNAVVTSRNNTSRRESTGYIIDYYKCKGEIICRHHPMYFYKDPPPKLAKTWEAMRVKRDDIKLLSDRDVDAFKLRALSSVYTWEELYGAGILHHEYVSPGSSVTFQLISIESILHGTVWRYTVKTNKPCTCSMFVIGPYGRPRPAPGYHDWEHGAYCIGGKAFMLPKIESLRYTWWTGMGMIAPNVYRTQYSRTILAPPQYLLFASEGDLYFKQAQYSGIYDWTGPIP